MFNIIILCPWIPIAGNLPTPCCLSTPGLGAASWESVPTCRLLSALLISTPEGWTAGEFLSLLEITGVEEMSPGTRARGLKIQALHFAPELGQPFPPSLSPRSYSQLPHLPIFMCLMYFILFYLFCLTELWDASVNLYSCHFNYISHLYLDPDKRIGFPFLVSRLSLKLAFSPYIPLDTPLWLTLRKNTHMAFY